MFSLLTLWWLTVSSIRMTNGTGSSCNLHTYTVLCRLLDTQKNLTNERRAVSADVITRFSLARSIMYVRLSSSLQNTVLQSLVLLIYSCFCEIRLDHTCTLGRIREHPGSPLLKKTINSRNQWQVDGQPPNWTCKTTPQGRSFALHYSQVYYST